MKFIKLHDNYENEMYVRADGINHIRNINKNHTHIWIGGKNDVVVVRETAEEILKLINNE